MYITNREYNTEISTKMMVAKGVPQGSALGPLLCNIFQTDVCWTLGSKNKESATVFIGTQYADDTSYVISANSEEDLNLMANEYLKHAEYWYTSNFLQLNISKFQVIIFCNKHLKNATNTVDSQEPNQIKIGDFTSDISNQIKIQGVELDNELTFLNSSKGVSNNVYRKLAT